MSQSVFLKHGYFVVSSIFNFLSLGIYTQACTYIFYKLPAGTFQLHQVIVIVQHNQSEDKPRAWSVFIKKKNSKTHYRRFFSNLMPERLCSFYKTRLHVLCQQDCPSPFQHHSGRCSMSQGSPCGKHQVPSGDNSTFSHFFSRKPFAWRLGLSCCFVTAPLPPSPRRWSPPRDFGEGGQRFFKHDAWHAAQDLLNTVTPVDLWCHFPQDDLCFHAQWWIHPVINAFGRQEQVFRSHTWRASRKRCGQPAFIMLSLWWGHPLSKTTTVQPHHRRPEAEWKEPASTGKAHLFI